MLETLIHPTYLHTIGKDSKSLRDGISTIQTGYIHASMTVLRPQLIIKIIFICAYLAVTLRCACGGIAGLREELPQDYTLAQT